MTNISVILISGGNPTHSVTSVELYYTNGSWICSLPDLPYLRLQHTQTGLTACGGHRSSPGRTTCHTLSSTGSWEESHTLPGEGRRQHNAWASPQGVVLIGGQDSSARTTTEILTENGDTTTGFNLDYEYR